MLAKTGLELLTSGNLSASASQSAGITVNDSTVFKSCPVKLRAFPDPLDRFFKDQFSPGSLSCKISRRVSAETNLKPLSPGSEGPGSWWRASTGKTCSLSTTTEVHHSAARFFRNSTPKGPKPGLGGFWVLAVLLQLRVRPQVPAVGATPFRQQLRLPSIYSTPKPRQQAPADLMAGPDGYKRAHLPRSLRARSPISQRNPVSRHRRYQNPGRSERRRNGDERACEQQDPPRKRMTIFRPRPSPAHHGGRRPEWLFSSLAFFASRSSPHTPNCCSFLISPNNAQPLTLNAALWGPRPNPRAIVLMLKHPLCVRWGFGTGVVVVTLLQWLPKGSPQAAASASSGNELTPGIKSTPFARRVSVPTVILHASSTPGTTCQENNCKLINYVYDKVISKRNNFIYSLQALPRSQDSLENVSLSGRSRHDDYCVANSLKLKDPQITVNSLKQCCTMAVMQSMGRKKYHGSEL
ncbi:hypothetical protein AAY473_033371 [Plecturocebus cupreus]